VEITYETSTIIPTIRSVKLAKIRVRLMLANTLMLWLMAGRLLDSVWPILCYAIWSRLILSKNLECEVSYETSHLPRGTT
jgi:hypothetical protein